MRRAHHAFGDDCSNELRGSEQAVVTSVASLASLPSRVAISHGRCGLQRQDAVSSV